jgi:hypothetical protein
MYSEIPSISSFARPLARESYVKSQRHPWRCDFSRRARESLNCFVIFHLECRFSCEENRGPGRNAPFRFLSTGQRAAIIDIEEDSICTDSSLSGAISLALILMCVADCCHSMALAWRDWSVARLDAFRQSLRGRCRRRCALDGEQS